jgi:thiol:disulfide interchange protein
VGTLLVRHASGAFAALVALSTLTCNRTPGEVVPEDAAAGGLPQVAPAASSTATTAVTLAAMPPRGESWNSSQIDWQPFEAARLQARAQNKPICLVISTTWCPHCKNYSHVFDDPRIVQRAHDFVMVRLDGDAQSDLASKYKPDGGYIPRTFFLGPDGELDSSLRLPRPRFQYFYDEHDPSSLLAGMESALKKLVH